MSLCNNNDQTWFSDVLTSARPLWGSLNCHLSGQGFSITLGIQQMLMHRKTCLFDPYIDWDVKHLLKQRKTIYPISYLHVILSGRINLVELQQILNVDFSHVESKVSELVQHDGKLDLVLGQLIDRYAQNSNMCSHVSCCAEMHFFCRHLR